MKRGRRKTRLNKLVLRFKKLHSQKDPTNIIAVYTTISLVITLTYIIFTS